jgi:2,4-dienoyl-CoA reductase-like NADH-dependent reductase (Old Yellow Enzyme family)
MSTHPLLFSPLNVGAVELRNRIVMPPMVTCMEAGGDQNHTWYVARARGGAGLILREATAIRELATAAFAERLKRTVDAVHEAGAAIAVQLMEWGRTAQGEPLAVSEREGVRAATEAELLELIDLYAEAAVQCRRVGFDGVEPHGAHGFFLNQFFSPVRNQREDAFGGSLEARMEMGLRIVRAIRQVVDPGCLILYRHTPRGEGYSTEDSRPFVRALQEAGVDILDVSPSTSSSHMPRADLAVEMKAAVDVPAIAVGGFGDVDAAENVLEHQRADLIAIGRGLIADPDLPNKVRDGTLDDIIHCNECNEKCYGNLSQGVPIGCALNPRSGLEYLAGTGG